MIGTGLNSNLTQILKISKTFLSPTKGFPTLFFVKGKKFGRKSTRLLSLCDLLTKQMTQICTEMYIRFALVGLATIWMEDVGFCCVCDSQSKFLRYFVRLLEITRNE